MRLQPNEITTFSLPKRLGRYAAESVDELIANVRGSYEELWHEHAEAQQTVIELRDELERYRYLDQRLSDVLLLAEQAAAERREKVEREVEALLDRARQEANDLVSKATAKRDRMQAETDALEQRARDLDVRYRAFLLAALELVADETDEPEAAHDDTSQAITGDKRARGNTDETPSGSASPHAVSAQPGGAVPSPLARLRGLRRPGA
jgi:cell division septum initiation protein DivIVA